MFISVSCRFKFKNKKVCIGCFYVKKKKKKLNIWVATPRSIFMSMHSSSHLQFQQSRLVSAGAGWTLGSLMNFRLLYISHPESQTDGTAVTWSMQCLWQSQKRNGLIEKSDASNDLN